MKPSPPSRPTAPEASYAMDFCDLPEDRPDLAADAKWLGLVALAGFAVTLGVRLLEALAWDSPLLVAAGERVLSTHDAYCWLAGAKGVNGYVGFGMSWLAGALAKLSGAPLWAVGFWAPAFLASLTAVAVGLWGWLLAGRRAAIAPALIGALSPAFFYRSRLGYFDTDVFTQLMPLLMGFGLGLLLLRHCRRVWVGAPSRDLPAPEAWLPWAALGFGLLARVAHFAHDDIQPLGVGLFWIAVFLTAAAGLPGRRAGAFGLLLVYLLAGYAGPRRFGMETFNPGLAGAAGLLLAAGLAWILWRRAKGQGLKLPAWAESPWPWLGLLCAAAVACGMLLPLGGFWTKAMSYFKPVVEAGLSANATGTQPPLYPGITQSVREAKNVTDLFAFFSSVSLSVETGFLGLIGVTALLTLRPAFLLLLPTTVLGFASLVLGMRFSMFGGPVFALGIGIGAHWLFAALARRFAWPSRGLVWVQVALAFGFLAVGYVPRSLSARPTPVLAPAHAEALMSLRDTAPRDASVWTWWDFGYATQYFSERMTPTDGGRHEGRDLFPTALALTTPSLRQSAQLIRLSASLGNDPAKAWDKLSGEELKKLLLSLDAEEKPPVEGPPQYIVVCWENIQLLYWMAFYGTWDVAEGKGGHASVTQIRESFDMRQDTGELTLKRSEQTVRLESLDVLSAGKRQFQHYPGNPKGAHLIINDMTRQAFLVDSLAYYSMALQLLMADPGSPQVSRYFKLVHEGFPLVRIYEVLQRPQGPQEQAKAVTK